jgi:hypothetical protein
MLPARRRTTPPNGAGVASTRFFTSLGMVPAPSDRRPTPSSRIATPPPTYRPSHGSEAYRPAFPGEQGRLERRSALPRWPRQPSRRTGPSIGCARYDSTTSAWHRAQAASPTPGPTFRNGDSATSRASGWSAGVGASRRAAHIPPRTAAAAAHASARAYFATRLPTAALPSVIRPLQEVARPAPAPCPRGPSLGPTSADTPPRSWQPSRPALRVSTRSVEPGV